MPTLDLVSSNDSLRRVLCEQATFDIAAHASLGQAQKAWETRAPELVIFENAALEGIESSSLSAAKNRHPSALFFALGSLSSNIDETLIAQLFSKPVRIGYLLLRLHFYAQASVQSRDVSLALGPWRFSPREKQLFSYATNETVKLTEMEASLLEYMCRAGKPVTRAEILADVWGYDDGMDTHTLETHIYRLRRKLNVSPATVPEGDVFLAERGGYRINPTWLSA